MKVLLLQPNYDSHVVHPPLGLGSLAAVLERDGHRVSIFDGTLKNATDEDFLDEIREFETDLVGISVMTRGHNKAKHMVRLIKKNFSDLPVFIGGTQVTAAPRVVLEDLGADFAIVGEGEITLLELVSFLEGGQGSLKRIKGLVFKDEQGNLIQTAERELITDLNTLPYPAWHLMPPSKYRIAPILEPAKALPVAPILTSRGCPFNCSFCASNITWRRRLRFRSVEHVIGEMKLLVEKYGVKEIHISDDNLTMDVARAERLCDAMIKENLNVSWQCPNGVRIDRLPISLLEKMKKAGCYAVGLGIESGNQEMLKRINKRLNLSIVGDVLKNLKKVGISSYGFFILGLPGDTRKTIEETIDFALNNPFDRAWFNIFTPYPGSPAFDEWLGNRKFSDIDWDKHDCSTAIMASEDLSLEEIEKYQKSAVRKFYLRPRVLYSVLSQIGYKEVTTLVMSRFFRKFFEPLFKLVHKTARRRKF